MKTAPIRCGECCFFKHECAINPFVYGVAIDAAILKLRRIEDEEV